MHYGSGASLFATLSFMYNCAIIGYTCSWSTVLFFPVLACRHHLCHQTKMGVKALHFPLHVGAFDTLRFSVRVGCKRTQLLQATRCPTATVVPPCADFSWTNVLKRMMRTVLESGSAVSTFSSDSRNGVESQRTGSFVCSSCFKESHA